MAEDEEGKKESKAGSAGQNIGDIAKLSRRLGGTGASSTAEAGTGAATAAGEAGVATGGTAAGTGAAGVGVGGAGAAGSIAAGGTAATAASGPAAPATAAATAAVAAIPLLKKVASKIPAIAIIGVCAVVFVFIFGLVVIFGPILGLLGGSGSASASEILKVTKTPDPSHINKGKPGDTAKVKYSFSIQNKSGATVDNVKLVDTFSGTHAGKVSDTNNCNSDIGQIAAGNTVKFECTVTINNIDDDWILSNTASVTGSQQASQPGGPTTSNLNYYIPFRDTAVKVINEEQMKATVANNPNWTNNFVYTDCGYGVSCWDYVKEKSIKAGVNPAFTLAIWIGESGASSSYGHPEGISSHFSCDKLIMPQTVDALRQSLSCFLYSVYGGTPPTGAFKGASSYSADQFERMLWDFCGSNTESFCANNPRLAETLKSWYSNLVPVGNYGALTSSSPASSCLNFSFANGAGSWTEDEKSKVNKAVSSPAAYVTWATFVCKAGGITLTRERAPDQAIVSAEVTGGNNLHIYDTFFNGHTASGQAFIMTHELTHILRNYNMKTVFAQYLASSAHDERIDKWIIRSYPLCITRGSCSDEVADDEDFAEMAGNFIGTRDGYPIDFQGEYPEHYKFAKDVLFGGSSPTPTPTGQTVSTSVSATVIIGDVPFTDPSGWPTTGTITQTPYCSYDPDNCPTHGNLSAVDIGTGLTPGTPVYATHSGTVTSGDASLEDFNKNDEIDDNDRATCRSNAATQGNYYGCTGIYVAIKGANYTTIYMHLQSINTACVPQNGSGQVVQGALIGFVDSTGNSTGNHLHYEIRQNNGSMVPLDSLSSVMPDWKVSSVEASYSGGGCGQ